MLKVGKPTDVDGFENINFKALRSHNHKVHEFTLEDIPLMDPYDWISTFNIINKDTMKYEPIYHHLRRVFREYIWEVTKMDVDIVVVLKRKLILQPFPQPDDLEKLKVGFIKRDRWGVVYKINENGTVKICMLFLQDKHMYFIASLNIIHARVEAYKSKSAADVICVSDILN